MLNKYIEELTKTASVQQKLDQHLEELTKVASQEAAQEAYLKNASVAELAKLAGVTLPENICGGCGHTMEKLGSIFQCECGLMKKAKQKTALMPIPGASQALRAVSSTPGRFAAARAARLAPAAQTAAQKVAPLLTGAGGGSLTARELAASQGPLQRAAGSVREGLGGLKQRLMGGAAQLEPKMVTASAEKIASVDTVNRTMKAFGGNVDMTLAYLENEGYTKLALGAFGTAAMGLAKAAPKALANTAKSVRNAYTMGAQGITRQGGKLVGGGTEGIMGGVKAVASRHPGLVGGAAAVPVVGAGYALGGGSSKQAADEGVRPGWGAAQGGMRRAMQRGGSGISQFIADPELIGERQTLATGHGLAGGGIGAGVGAGAGLLASLVTGGKIRPGAGAGIGAAGGGILGLMGGQMHGQIAADKKFLGKRGITPHWGGLTGATFSPEAAKKYLPGADHTKTSSVERLLEIGDAAGRVMAKVAVEVDPSEVTESIEEARNREDVSGRSRKWGAGGALLGGLGGGALGGAAGHFLGNNPWARGIGAGVGALSGGFGGAMLGSRQGAEEAEADRLVSMLRGRRAFGVGANEGYQAGMQAGYMAGMQQAQGGGEAGPQ